MNLEYPIYLDNNATTAVDEVVLQAMLPYFSNKFGNASSRTHVYGWQAADAVDLARERIAQLINAEPNEIIFTSGATEGINLALKGIFELYQSKGKHIITALTEHKAVLDSCEALEKKGAEISYLPVDSQGFINLSELEKAIRPDTILISIMLANNEIGAIQPVAKIAEIAHAHKLIFMSDATQAIGKMAVDVQSMGIDIMPLNAHKCYGPKGVGALFVRRRSPRVRLFPQLHGGGHEKGMRSGTLNVPGIVGLGMACEMAQGMTNYLPQIARLRDKLETGLLEIEGTFVNGTTEQRLANTCNISFRDINSQMLMKTLSSKIAVSSGSACTSAEMEPSYVLSALGLSDRQANASIRFSLSKYSTETEIDYAIELLKKEVGIIKMNQISFK